jgi:hypothetical protein
MEGVAREGVAWPKAKLRASARERGEGGIGTDAAATRSAGLGAERNQAQPQGSPGLT